MSKKTLIFAAQNNQNPFARMSSFAPYNTLADGFDRLFQLIENSPKMALNDEQMDSLWQVCESSARYLKGIFDEHYKTICENRDIYRMDECYTLDYALYVSKVEHRISYLPNGNEPALKSLKKTLRDFVTCLQKILREINLPKNDKQHRIFDYILDHYNNYYWESDSTSFAITLNSIRTQRIGQRLKLLSQERLRHLRLLLECDFVQLRIIDDQTADEAYASLRTESGPFGLDPLCIVAHILAKRTELKGYEAINIFLRLNRIIFELDQAIAETETALATQETQRMVNNLLQTTEPLALAIGTAAGERFTAALRRVLSNPEVITLMQKPELGESYNLKLLLNIMGILHDTDNMLPLSLAAISSNFGTKRRDDYIRYNRYSDYSSSYSAITAALHSRILDIIKT